MPSSATIANVASSSSRPGPLRRVGAALLASDRTGAGHGPVSAAAPAGELAEHGADVDSAVLAQTPEQVRPSLLEHLDERLLLLRGSDQHGSLLGVGGIVVARADPAAELRRALPDLGQVPLQDLEFLAQRVS